MHTKLFIDEAEIFATRFELSRFTDPATDQQLLQISFDFKVTSKEYHDIAVLLYRPEFTVRLPDENLEFPATISNYSTSVTNLYKENQVADYKLELVEKH